MNKKLVLNERFRGHMENHCSSFNKNYVEYLTPDVKEEILNKCASEKFNVVHVKFDSNIGTTNIAKVNDTDSVFWAKRKGRDIYSRFVKGKEPKPTNIITFVVKEQHYNKGVFNLISMYPSIGKSEKEVFDQNIDTIEELERCINFWTEFAFVDKDYVKGTEKDIIEKNNILFNKEIWFEINYTENNEEASKYFSKLKCNKLNLKNLYYGSKTTKIFDEFGNFIESECKYTGLRFNYMCNGSEFKIGYAGNKNYDFAEEIYLVG